MTDTLAWLRDGYLSAMRSGAVFRGRSARAQLWAFTIVCGAAYLAATGVDRLVGVSWPGFRGVRLAVLSVHVLPFCALVVRRLHDLDRRGWSIVWPPHWALVYRMRGTRDPNRFGAAETGPDGRGRAPAAPSRSDPAGSDDRERVVDTTLDRLDAFRLPTWFIVFWVGAVLCFFGGLMAFVFTINLVQHGTRILDRNWAIGLAVGALSLTIGGLLLRRARTLYGRR